MGAVIVRRIHNSTRLCRIVETEAYYGPWDPASRAYRHRRGRIVERLRGPVGVLLIYGIHRQWLVNIIAHEPGDWGAVLLRACEPLEGTPLDTPPKGPGRLSRALLIDKSLDGIPVYDPGSPVQVTKLMDDQTEVRVVRSKRVGVTMDLKEPLRFCLEGSKYLSKPC
ncbi:MAG: DNA-3-methyladenine glycosylase [Desulfurococcales archaeon]|nr:DNA-3-methyladenine glycosylase [Desulfurococcales archaeon]